MSNPTRRTALAFLGLTGATSVALSTEAMVEPSARGLTHGGQSDMKLVANALRKLADGIERHEVLVFGLDVSSSLRPDQIITQKLVVEFSLDE